MIGLRCGFAGNLRIGAIFTPMENFGIIILLLFGVTFLGVLSNRYNFPFPIVLVLCGVGISLIPGLPAISLNPDVVFIIFLPPLLYGAAWYTNWHEFRANARPIGLAAIGLVLFTTTLVAWAAHSLIPGIDWPTGFLIGAIVSPPDAIAATSVTKNLGLHPRILAILEGESLVNDASGLIAYRYALAAITAGNFVLWEAGLNFLWASSAGIGIGLAIGFLMYQVHTRFICDPIIEVTLTFLTPFASYLIAEHFHLSGVLAVVATGLFLSFRSAKMFSHESRIKTYAVWDVVQYILNGVIFIFIGLELREVIHAIREYKLYDLVLYGAVISAVVIVVRFIWVVPAALLPRVFTKVLREKEALDSRNLVIFGWAGMRGVVSLAAALAIPLTLDDKVTPFPHRSLIIYITFCVILSTLVILGFTLPWVIRLMKVPKHSIVVEEYTVRQQVVSNAISHIEENLSLLPDEILHNLKSKYEVKFNRLQKTDLPANYFGKGNTLSGDIFNEYSKIQIDLISVERETLTALHRSGEASDEVIRKIERELDLEESRLNMEMYNG